MTHLVFIDTETTGLNAAVHEAWEVAIIVRDHPQPEFDGQWCWRLAPRNLLMADGNALRIGNYYTRGFFPVPADGESTDDVICMAAPGTFARADWDRVGCARYIAQLTQGATFIANNAAFDARFIERVLRSESLVPAWDYRVIDVVGMAAGHLSKPLPWRSEQLSRDCGVEPPSGDDRHSALGDARWVERWWDHLTTALPQDGDAASTDTAHERTP